MVMIGNVNDGYRYVDNNGRVDDCVNCLFHMKDEEI